MKHLKTIISVLVLAVAVSCAKTQSTTGGQVNFAVSSNDLVTDVTKSNVSDYTSLPTSADFTITVTGEDYTWTGKISTWSAETILNAGEYSVTAIYGDLENEEGFDKPFFTGTKTFTIVGGEQATVSIPVTLGNAIVRMTFTDAFNNYYPQYSFRLSRDGKQIATFAKGETRAAFLDPWKFKLEGTLVGEMKTSTFSKDYSNLNVGTAYTFKFDVNNVGGATITINFNNTVEIVELGDYELND